MSAQIYIARHGQDEDNANSIFNGHRDRPLTELGRNQAKQLAKEVVESGIKFDFVYSSPLRRAYKTAQTVSELAEQPAPVFLPELIERDLGNLTGLESSAAKVSGQAEFLEVNGKNYIIEADGAETPETLFERASRVLDFITRAHGQATVLLVCHENIGTMLYAVAKNQPWKSVLETVHLNNCTLVRIK